MDYAKEIRRVIQTLDNVEVRGRDNMDRLLGSVIHLEKVAADMEQAAQATAPAGGQ